MLARGVYRNDLDGDRFHDGYGIVIHFLDNSLGRRIFNNPRGIRVRILYHIEQTIEDARSSVIHEWRSGGKG